MEGHKSFIDKAIWALKLGLLLVGAVSSATLFKVAVIPYLLDLALSTVPEIWSSFKSGWVSPLYVYIAVIAAIFVSSTFFHQNPIKITNNNNNNNNNSSQFESTRLNSVSSLDKIINYNNSWESFHILDDQDSSSLLSSPPEIQIDGEDEEEESGVGPGDGGESSLEETWQAIVAAGRGPRRSETFPAGPTRALERRTEAEEEEIFFEKGKRTADAKQTATASSSPMLRAHKQDMKKSETFSDRVSFRRDLSISTEELGRRADAFIKKVNDDMRLQRLESEQRYLEMVNRSL